MKLPMVFSLVAQDGQKLAAYETKHNLSNPHLDSATKQQQIQITESQ